MQWPIHNSALPMDTTVVVAPQIAPKESSTGRNSEWNLPEAPCPWYIKQAASNTQRGQSLHIVQTGTPRRLKERNEKACPTGAQCTPPGWRNF